jgi:hypothetical protein
MPLSMTRSCLHTADLANMAKAARVAVIDRDLWIWADQVSRRRTSV